MLKSMKKAILGLIFLASPVVAMVNREGDQSTVLIWGTEQEAIVLLASGYDVNSVISYGPLQGYAPIHIAAMRGQVGVIDYLRKHGVDINTAVADGPNQGETPIYIAAMYEQDDVTSYLNDIAS